MIQRHRLRGRGRFAAVRAGGVRATAGAVRVTVAPNGSESARVGFALAGLRSAVTRNRLRRRLREAVRPLLADLAGLDVIVATRADAATRTFAALRTDLLAATTRAVQMSKGSAGRPTADNAEMITAAVQQ